MKLAEGVVVKPKKFLNDPVNAVEEFIDGLLLQYPNHLAKLQNHNVVLAAAASQQQEKEQVQLICGGGSGHEPSHAGFVGSGMLSAAVCGGMFASPAVTSILAAIRATSAAAATSSKAMKNPVLVVIKNYTGDRLNFGMAAERAAEEGIHIQTVVVADDCAVPRTKGITGARGVAGTVLVNKIAGGAAAAGQSLDQVANLARLVCRRMGSLGVALNAVTIPGAESVNDRLQDDNTIEIGLGIHGEAGIRQSPLLPADEIARELITTIQAHGRPHDDDGSDAIIPLFVEGDEVVLLINNLGGTSNFEMSILARSCVHLLESDALGFGKVRATRVLVGSFMTSFDMHGASLTILNVTGQDEMLQFLDAPTTAPGWPSYVDVWNTTTTASTRPSVTPVPEVTVDTPEATASLELLPPFEIPGFAEAARRWIVAATTELANAEPLLTKYDTIVGDGDCGITMKRGAVEIASRLEQGIIPTHHPVIMYRAIADAISASMGGTSGVLLELMFRKMSSYLLLLKSTNSPNGVAEMGLAFQAGVDAVKLYGGASVGSRTMMDALIPAAAALVEATSLSASNSSGGFLNAAATKAQEGADATAEMTRASAGRSNYLSEETLSSGTPDPGAAAAAIVLKAMASVA